MKSQLRSSQPQTPAQTPESRFARLWEVVCRLRSPEGCPWDRQQDFASMKSQFLDEVYEYVDALERDDAPAMAEELGDLFFHLLFFCRLGEDGERFTLDEVLAGIGDKLIRRHPHVFGRESGAEITPDEVRDNWEKIKREVEGKSYSSLLDGIPDSLPPLEKACAFGKKAAGVGFDWPDAAGVLPKLKEEVGEVEEVLQEGGERLEEELGDLLFVVVNLVRLAGFEPGRVLHRANRKFSDRFRAMEEQARAAGTELSAIGLEEQEKLWQQAKNRARFPGEIEKPVD
jgi:tetrapyrrole methylase family protein/MazG family protein